MHQSRVGRAGVQHVGDCRQFVEVHFDRGGEVLGLGAGRGDADGDGLADMAHLVLREHRLLRRLEAGQRTDRDDRRDAGQIGGREHQAVRLADRADARVGDRAAHEGKFLHAGQPDVGDEHATAAQVAIVLLARNRTPDALSVHAALARRPIACMLTIGMVSKRWGQQAVRHLLGYRTALRAVSYPGSRKMDGHIDLLLRGGRVIDPAASRDGMFDVAIGGGRILAVEPAIPAEATRVVDVTGKLVLPGMIDTHAHVYQGVTGKFGLDPDMVGVQSCVTTVVDQGGPSCMTIPGFRRYIVQPSRTRVVCFISAYLVGGLEGHLYPELYGPGQVNVEHTVKAARENADIVRGIKAHAETGGVSRWGLEVIKLGKRMAREAGLPLYIHLGQLWPTKDDAEVDADEVVRTLIPLMDEGDVLAHPFTRHPGGFISSETGEVHPVVWEALARGVTVDVGHGSHFSFDMARKVLAAGIAPFTLGADMHGYNVRVPDAADGGERARNPFFGVAPFNLTHAMTELLTLGMALPEIVATVTANPARMLRMSDTIGTLLPGREADVSVLEVLDGRFELRDNSGARVAAPQMIVPVFALRAGERFDAASPLIPAPMAVAA